jgi:hypothetical protein
MPPKMAIEDGYNRHITHINIKKMLFDGYNSVFDPPKYFLPGTDHGVEGDDVGLQCNTRHR